MNFQQKKLERADAEAEFIAFPDHHISTKLELKPCDRVVEKYTGWSHTRWLMHYKEQQEGSIAKN